MLDPLDVVTEGGVIGMSDFEMIMVMLTIIGLLFAAVKLTKR